MNVTSTRNRLLQALPPAELDQLLPSLSAWTSVRARF